MPTILIVDDEHDLRTAFGAVLRHEGHDVHTASTVEQALQVFDRARPDLVLLDIRLGDLGYDGLYLLRRMRERMPQVKAVMVSAYLDRATRHVALAAGALDCWSKPLTMQMLTERTAQVLAAPGLPPAAG